MSTSKSRLRKKRRPPLSSAERQLLRYETLETRVMLASDLPFSPVLGLEASDGVVFDSGTGAVSEWQDQSGSSNHLQAIGSEQPAYGATQTPSGLDAISFDGVDDRLLRTLTDPGGISNLPTNNRDRSVFVVAQFQDASGFGGATYGRGTINQAFGVGVAGNSGDLVVQGWGAGNDFQTAEKAFDPPGTSSGWMLLSVVHTKDNNDPADNLFYYQNGTQIGAFDHKFNTKLLSTVDLNGNTAARMVIGQEIKEEGFIELDIAAWAVYDQALDATERQAVETYLTDKYLTPTNNQPPTAVDDVVTIDDGSATTIDILANDTDSDGTIDATSVVIVDQPTQATIFSVDPATGVVSYTHDGSSTTDSFTYTVLDDDGDISNIATVTINLSAPNQAPVAVEDFFFIDSGESAVFDVIGNDTDSDGTIDPTTVTISGPATQATLSVDPVTGAVTYNHNGSQFNDSFTYTVRDNDGAISNVGNVAIILNPDNVAPTANDDSVAIDDGATVVIDLVANDVDSDGSVDPRRVSLVDFPEHAVGLSLDLLTGQITYTHDGSASPDSFTYTVQDDDGAVSNVATVTISINPANQAPTANDDGTTIDDGTSTLIDVLANDTDSDGTIDATSVVIIDQPLQATSFSVDPITGEISYTHDGSGASDSFTYTVLDEDGAVSNIATVTISVTTTNQAPIAINDSESIADGANVLIDILANDIDTDGTVDPTSVVIVDQPAQASSFSVDPITGEVDYTHDGSGINDSFTYTVLDDLGQISNLATVNLLIGQQPLSLAGFSSELVTSTGLNQPISLAFFPDGRMLILEKGGVIHIVDPNSGIISPYMTLTNIDAGGEKGLLDIAVAPDFDPDSPGDDYIYLYYTPATPRRARIARFTHQENSGGLTSTGDLSSELLIWEDTDGYISCCHYGGGLDHGPDGKLWLTVSDKFTAPNPGEGGSNDNLPQDLTSASGKIIRVNTDGSIPDGTDGWAANPFIDPVDDDPNLAGNQDYLDSIWAYGLRNPFRAEWDLESGRFFIGEVGGNVQTESYEDVHIATLDNPGVNYGWPYYEGAPAVEVLDPNGAFAPTHGFDPTVHDEPIFAYPHDGAGASLTGGEVYRGSQFPAEWDGVYFYGDFTRDFIRYVTFDPAGEVTGDFPFLPTAEITQVANQVVHIAVGPDGALYYVLIGGQVRRVVHSGGNQAPTIQQAVADVSSGDAPLSVNFTAQVADPEGDALTFVWNFGDGNSVSGNVANGVAIASHTYAVDGSYQAFVEFNDGSQTVISDFVPIQVGPIDAAPSITQLNVTPTSGDSPLLVSFSALATDPDSSSLTYEVFFGNGLSSGSKVVPVDGMISEDYTYDDDGSYNAFIVVTDGSNVAQTVSTEINVGPTQLPPITDDLILLLESDIKVPVSTGTTVAGWLDGSGNANNLESFGDPQLVANGTPGGQPSIVLDGNGDFFERLASDTINNFPSGADDRTVFSVVKYVDAEGVAAGVAFGKANFNRAFGLVTDPNDGTLTVQSGVNAADLVSTAAGEGAGWLTHSVVVSNDVTTQYKDGVAIGSQTHTYQTRMDAPNSRLVLGEELGGLGQSQMEFAAVLIYDRALTEIERLQVEDYLFTKYFVGNLPPVAADDSGLVATGAAAVIDILANDTDADGVLNPATVTIVDQPTSGTLTIDGVTGAVTYQHDGGVSTSDSFTYTVDDEVNATSGIATVTITVAAGTLETDGLVFALESDAGVANDGGTGVVGWLDSSGLGNDLQTVVGDPTIVSGATPSGEDAISFDGDDSLARLGATDALNGLPSGAADRSIFIVAQYNSVSALSGVSYGNGGMNQAFGLVADPTTGNLGVQGWGAGNDFVSAEPGVSEGWLVQSAVLSSNNLDHYRDGQLVDTAFHAFSTQTTDLQIGEEIDGLGFADMDVAAVLIYDRALTEMERQEVQAYLHSKYL
ncbi:MAG: Ig-like domain-containing protein [Planctomycetota bacterium]